MPRVRGRSNASLSISLSLDADDPLSRALQPPVDETPIEREERLRAEREAKRVSDEIDEEIKKERAAIKKKRPVRVLLLGQSESGKSTTLKNFQIHYAPQAWRDERAAWRAVIQLNLIRSIALVMDTIAASPTDTDTTPPSTPTHNHHNHHHHHYAPPDISPLLTRYAPLLSRLAIAERILQRRLSPTDSDEPGDYRSFTASSPPSNPTTTTALTDTRSTQEFFVRASGGTSWKARFLRRLSASTSSTSTPSSPISPSPPTGSATPPLRRSSDLRSSLDFRGRDPPAVVVGGGAKFDPATSPDDGLPPSPTRILQFSLLDMKALWADGDVRAALARAQGGGGPSGLGPAGGTRHSGPRVEDMPGFFLNDVERIAAKGYEPSDDDVIRARLRTMGVQEHRFTFERGLDSGREWRIFDVGGARSQATSWLSFFDDMDAIIFLAPISCFDETLAEDRRVNRLEDSITLWRTICRSPLLARVQLILFLNKVDLLRRKIAHGTRIARHVTSFGDRTNDVETVCKYFKQKFKEIQRQYSPEPRPYYVYFTSVTDTKATGITLGIGTPFLRWYVCAFIDFARWAYVVREGILRANLHRADFI